MGVDGQHHTPAALPLGKKASTHHTGGCVHLRAGLDRYGNFFFSPLDFNAWTIQPVASRYTDSLLQHTLHTGMHVKYPLVLSDFIQTYDFLDKVLKNPQCQIL